MNLPNGSAPVRVITADRRPYLAAATATLVALPPSHLPKVCTSSSPTPVCSGYRSTPTRPMVRTSSCSPTCPDAPPWKLLLDIGELLTFYACVSGQSRVCIDIFTSGRTWNQL